MRAFFLLVVLLWSCGPKTNKIIKPQYANIKISSILEKDSLSIRALEISDQGFVFSGNNNQVGTYNAKNNEMIFNKISLPDEKTHEFRGIAPTPDGFYIVSVANPAKVLHITDVNASPKQVYYEKDEAVFYDAMKFWNDQEGIALGDAMNGCMSIIVTRNGGKSWQKLGCDQIPSSTGSEGAFAASNTNIEIKGDHVWCATGRRILHSPDKGHTWTAYDTPIIQEKPTQGMYSLDFYDAKRGMAIGGDYTAPDSNKSNLISTEDGGKTWNVISNASSPGYRSCIQYIPQTDAQGVLAVGFKGIDLSLDGGKTWKHLSDESFYTVRFIDSTSGYLAGKGRIAAFELE